MSDVNTITVNVPIAFKRRRGRKRLVAPDGRELVVVSQPTKEIDNALVKAIARAYRWQRMLESGEFATLRELAAAERLDAAYISRMLKLTLLPPVMVEAILAGQQSREVTLNTLIRGEVSVWPATARERSVDARDDDGRNRFPPR